MSSTGTSGRRERASRPLDRDIIATLGVIVYSVVVALGFARVFGGWSFVPDMLALVLVGHGLSFVLRRASVSGFVAVPLAALVLTWLVLYQHYGDTLSALVPTGETWDRVDLELGLVQDQFRSAVAPVLYGAGWAPLAGIAMVLTVVLSDTFAFRADARGEALVPGGVLFVFIAALGTDRLRVPLTAMLVAAGLVAVVVLRSLHDRRRRVELSATPARWRAGVVLPSAIGSALAIALIAGVVGPRVPGADAEPLYDTRAGGGGVTEIVSPLVDIRSRLVNQRNLELFRVNTTAASYWRATTLPEFDGDTFRLPQRTLEPIDSSFAADGGNAVEIIQQLQVVSLGGQLVPAAPDPVAASGDRTLRYNDDTATLVVTGASLESGDLLNIVSTAKQLGPDQLRAATTGSPPDPIYLELPDEFPDDVTELATQVAAGATNPYDAAIALQSWFRSEFDYSLEVQQGHGSSAIESFLQERVGYCEQFSATFAAMARGLGIPSRVAVGYTPGVQNPDGWYSVRGKNAHAWPELWFDGIGWVAFEPTPGRGAPGNTSYTNVEPAQDTSAVDGSGDGDAGVVGTLPTVPPTFVPPEIIDPLASIPTGALPPGEFQLPPGSTAVDDDDEFPWTPLVVLCVLALAAAMPAISVRVRRRLRHRQPAAVQVADSWRRAVGAARRAGVEGTSAMTPHEWAMLTGKRLPVAARPMGSLAELIDTVTFAAPGTVELTGGTRNLVHDARIWTHQVESVVDGPRQVLWRYFTTWS